MLLLNKVASGADATETTNFLSRADAVANVDTTHRPAYKALINNLVSDGIFAKFDCLYILAAQVSGHALLNLVSTNATTGPYPLTANGSPGFTADNGYLGVDSSSTVYLDTTFNTSTASSPKFTQNNAHMSVWCIGNASAAGCPIGQWDPTGLNRIGPWSGSGKCTISLNNSGTSNEVNVTTGYSQGSWIATRTSSSNQVGYFNGSSLGTSNQASVAPFNGTVWILSQHGLGGNASYGAGNRVAQASIGSSLSSTEANTFYTRLRTYMTAVGVP